MMPARFALVSGLTQCVRKTTRGENATTDKSYTFQRESFRPHQCIHCYSSEETSGGVMQLAITFIAVVAGLILSLAVALVTEELIFGQIMRLFFERQTMGHK
jgi:hypothetical protein